MTPSCWQKGERITLLEAATAANRTQPYRAAARAPLPPVLSTGRCLRHPRGHAPAVVAEQVLVPFSQLTGVVAPEGDLASRQLRCWNRKEKERNVNVNQCM